MWTWLLVPCKGRVEYCKQQLLCLQSLNYYCLALYRKSLLTSVAYHDLSSGYMHVHVWKISSSYILSMTTPNTKEEGKEGREGGRRETLKIQKYVLEQVTCKGHAMHHTDGWEEIQPRCERELCLELPGRGSHVIFQTDSFKQGVATFCGVTDTLVVQPELECLPSYLLQRATLNK